MNFDSIGGIEKTVIVSRDLFKITKKKYGVRIRKAVETNWSPRFIKILWDNFRLPCLWVCKRASYRTDDILCTAYCKQCKAGVKATMPHRTDNLQICITNYKPSFIHDTKKKRWLLPDERDELKNRLRGESAYAVRSQLASEILVKGYPEPSHFLSLNTIRKIKSSDQCPENKNCIDALHELMDIHVNCIQNIGYIPFYVFFATLAQMELYARLSSRKRSIIFIDATGVGLKSPTNYNKYIVLYVICVQG